jgi:CheY-like chemotaxis protein
MDTHGRERIVVAAVTDLFFAAKIASAAGHAQVTLIQASNAADLSSRLASIIPDLIILDLNDDAMQPLEVIRQVKSDERLAGTTVVGYCSHVEELLRRNAEQAGCDHVLPRSAFSKNLHQIIAHGPV